VVLFVLLVGVNDRSGNLYFRRRITYDIA